MISEDPHLTSEGKLFSTLGYTRSFWTAIFVRIWLFLTKASLTMKINLSRISDDINLFILISLLNWDINDTE